MKLLIIGSGGHCLSVLDSINREIYNEIVVLGQLEDVGKKLIDIPVIGTDEMLPELYKNGFNQCIIAIGSIGETKIRHKLEQTLNNIGFSFKNIIDRSAVVSKHVNWGVGNFVGKCAVINAGCTVGNHAIINTSASVDHDCNIGDFAHLAPGVTLSGGVKVCSRSHIGTGATIIQGFTIGADSLIGAGSVVVSDIPDNVVAYGNPCKIIKERV